MGQSVGAAGLAAISVVFPIAILQMASSVIVGVGGNALFAIRMGEGKRDEAEKVFGNAAVLLVAIPLCLSVIIALFADPVLLSVGASAETLPLAREYCLITLVGNPLSSFSHGMTHFIRTDGHPRTAMLSQIVAAVANIILDAIFVFGLGWGVAGAAWATVAAQLVGTIYVLVYFLSPLSTVKLRRKNLPIEWRRIAFPFMFLGLPHFAMQVASSAVNALLNRSLLFYGGDLAVSAISIVMSANTLLIMPMLGLSMGSQPILGFNFGARKFDRVVGTYKLGCMAAMAYGAFSWAVSFFFTRQVVRIFTSDNPALIDSAAHALRIFNMMLPIIGFQMMTSTLLQSVGRPMRSLVMSLSRQVLILIPLLNVLPHFFGLSGIYAAYPTSDFLSCILAATLGYFTVRRLKDGTLEAFTLGQGNSSGKTTHTPPADDEILNLDSWNENERCGESQNDHPRLAGRTG